MIGSKLKELMIALRGGAPRPLVVTLPYPLGPGAEVPEGFRGKVEVDVSKCVGCGGCANVCPSRCILIEDTSQLWRKMTIMRERCTYCARCQEVCQEKAITLTCEFELATDDPADLTDTWEVFMATCSRCGRCFKPKTVLDKMMEVGFKPPMGRRYGAYAMSPAKEALEDC
jgi:hydrogenase-4 component H